MKLSRWSALPVLVVFAASPQISWTDTPGNAIVNALETIVIPTSGKVGDSFDSGFGTSVDMDGNLMVVGAPLEDRADGTGANSGAVYVFERTASGWVQRQRIVSDDSVFNDQFGTSVAISLGNAGLDFLVVGTPRADSGTGKVYVYRRDNGGMWEFDSFVSQVGPQAGDGFGTDVDIGFSIPPNSQTGDPIFILVVGAPDNEEPGGISEGSVSIFQYLGGPPAWVGPAEFFGFNPITSADDVELGHAVAIGGPFIIGGVPLFDESGFQARGAAFFYGQGNQQPGGGFAYGFGGRLEAADPVAGQQLGLSATLDGSTGLPELGAVGAPLNSEVASFAGAVYIFEFVTFDDPRNEVQKLQASDAQANDEFGRSVAMYGRVLLVGAPGVDNAGAVYVFERGATFNSWSEIDRITPSTLGMEECFSGTSVALHRATAVSGCPPGFNFATRAALVYDGAPIFADGFESGDVSAWSSSAP